MAQNILEYTISLKDLMSSRLKQLSDGGKKLGNQLVKVANNAKKLEKEFSVTGVSVNNLQKKINLLRNTRDLLPTTAISSIRKYNTEIKQLENQIERLQTINGGWFKNKMSEAVSSIPSVLKNPIVGMGVMLGTSVKRGMEAELQKANITTLMRGDNGSPKYKNNAAGISTQTLFKGGSKRWQQQNGEYMRNKRSVWVVPTRPFKGAHIATFPPDLIRPELNAEYVKITENRLR